MRRRAPRPHCLLATLDSWPGRGLTPPPLSPLPAPPPRPRPALQRPTRCRNRNIFGISNLDNALFGSQVQPLLGSRRRVRGHVLLLRALIGEFYLIKLNSIFETRGIPYSKVYGQRLLQAFIGYNLSSVKLQISYWKNNNICNLTELDSTR